MTARDPILLTCTVPVASAISRGVNRAGRYDHPITEAELAELTRDDLVDTARPFLILPGEMTRGRLAIHFESWHAIKNALLERRESASTLRARRAAEAEFLREWAPASMRDRHAEGTLPEDELLELVRSIHFVAFRFQKYGSAQRPQISEIRHREHCRVAPRDRDWVQFETLEGATLTEAQHDERKEIRAQMKLAGGRGVEMTEHLRTHVAACSDCGAQAQRQTLLVSFAWHGRTLSREFLLQKRG